MVKEFATIGDLIKDPEFIRFVDLGINDLRTQRLTRPEPKPGYYYKRGWYERMTEAGAFNRDFFLKHIEVIWTDRRRSPLSSEFRRVIKEVCDIAVYKTHEYYKALPEPEAPSNEALEKVETICI